VKYGNIPTKSSIQYDGLFNSYFFPVKKLDGNCSSNKKKEENSIGARISYSKELNILNSNDILNINSKNKNEEIFISILINCLKDGVKEITKSLDVVIALDISGSMSSNLPITSEETKPLSCLELAKAAIKDLNQKFISLVNKNKYSNDFKGVENCISHRLGLCTFDDLSYTIFNLTAVEELGVSLSEKLDPINVKGGTNLFNGLAQAWRIMQKDCRSEAEKKILFLTDMQDTHDTNFMNLLREIANKGVSIDVIGIGQKLDLAYSEDIANIANVSVHSAYTQEEMRTILVEDFEFNFFPIAKNFKIEIYSNNLNVLKSYGTGYEMVSSGEVINDENSELLKNQIKTNKSLLVYFNLLKSFYKKRFKRIPLFVLQTICNFLKFKKCDVAEFEKLYPSNILISNCYNENNENSKKQEQLKSVKGNMILLKAEIADLDLHRQSGQREFAEIVFNYTDCEDEQKKKVYFPVCFEFAKTFNNENKIYSYKDNKGINNKNTDSYCSERNFIEAEYKSDAINIGVSLYYTAKFLRKILKEYHKNSKHYKNNSNQAEMYHLNASQEQETNYYNREFLCKQNLMSNRDLLFCLLKSKLSNEHSKSIQADLFSKIEKLLNRILNEKENDSE